MFWWGGAAWRAAAVDSLRGKSHPKGAPIAESELDCLHIKPRAGMACIHFPTTVAEYGCLRDVSTSHESEEAISPKFIVQQCSTRHELVPQRPPPLPTGDCEIRSIHSPGKVHLGTPNRRGQGCDQRAHARISGSRARR